MNFQPRLAQLEVARFRQGRMGVSAVPGSGKTQTLSHLAAELIAEGALQEGQEVLVVTLVNSAVDNFTARIEGFIHKSGLIPGLGYRVRTLHGLAHDIVRERPDLVNISNHFEIVDEREANRILDNAVTAWVHANPDFIRAWTRDDLDRFHDSRLPIRWQELVGDVTRSYISQAKDLQATPHDIRQRLDGLKRFQPLLEMGWQIYADYQRALAYRGALDFADLIRLAADALQRDPDFLARLRYRWPYILEDEAQDSSRLQEFILRTLVGEKGNWVRVGDPNQAIFETFTTASPDYLRNFLREPGVQPRTLPNSGRSTHAIINLANQLIRTSLDNPPTPALQGALDEPEILPTTPGDPQPNPSDRPGSIHISTQKFSPDHEVEVVVKSLKRWLPDHLDWTVAILVPRNERGAKVVEALKNNSLPYHELLKSTQSTRETAGILMAILRYLSDPAVSGRLADVYQQIHTTLAALNKVDPLPDPTQVERFVRLVRRCPRLEDYLQPRPGSDWLETLAGQNTPPEMLAELSAFRQSIQRWLQAVLLPIDQLVLTLAQELFTQPADLALAHKIALLLERLSQQHLDWRLLEFTNELESIAHNRSKFSGLSEDDTGFDPQKYKGVVVVSTIHKAKGLEWDRVYLLSVNNYDYPANAPGDDFISEKWFLQPPLNLEAESTTRLKALLEGDIAGVNMENGIATQEARVGYARERLRLVYVGVTRARKELMLSYNTGRGGNLPECQPAQALLVLDEYLKGQNNAAAT